MIPESCLNIWRKLRKPCNIWSVRVVLVHIGLDNGGNFRQLVSSQPSPQEEKVAGHPGGMETAVRRYTATSPGSSSSSSFHRTITVVRGNTSLGMWWVCSLVLVSLCVYIVSIATLASVVALSDVWVVCAFVCEGVCVSTCNCCKRYLLMECDTCNWGNDQI